MIHVWRLSEANTGNLGLAFTESGLLLGKTPLIERRGGRFVVRARAEVERLLERAYQTEVDASRLMPGLTTVASALNANDPCMARIAAVHLKVPDLPNAAARDALEAEDILVKSANWNPDLHPRAGAPPNPGWFAPTGDGGNDASTTRTAQNDNSTHRSDLALSAGDGRAKLPPDQRIDELGDFLEWLANAKAEDEKTIRAEIRRYYYDVGDTIGGDALNAALSDVLEPGVTSQARQEILNGIAPYANADPAEVAQARDLTVGTALLFSGTVPPVAIVEAPSEAWKLGWAARGIYFSERLGANLPATFKTIDVFENGTATSIKSIDLNASTYQSAARLTSALNRYINKLAEYEGSALENLVITNADITSRTLNIAVPRGSVTSVQRIAIDAAKVYAERLGIRLIVTPF